jgi:hypothetical protein
MLAQLSPLGADILSKIGDKSRKRTLVVICGAWVVRLMDLSRIPGACPYLVTIKSFPWPTYFLFALSAMTCSAFPRRK